LAIISLGLESAMITKVEKGLINIDFVKDRITLKAYLDSGDYIPCKLYNDGRLVSFSGDCAADDFYEERLIEEDLANEIKSKL
jgi:hypothetical protein